jgi:predicted exporter
MTSRRVVIGIWLLGLLLAGLLVARTPFSTDMSAFLPRAPAPAQQMLVDQLREGVVSRLVLVAMSDAPPEVLAALSHDLAADLRGDARFTLVSNGETAALARERDLIWRNRYLLSPGVTAERFTEAGLRAALEAGLAMLGTDLAPLVKRTLPADPTGEALRLLQAASGQARPTSQDGVWFTRDGASALLMVSTAAAGFDIDGQEQALTHLRAAFDRAVTRVPQAEGATLIATGPPSFAVTSRARIKGDAELLSLIATMLVAGVLLLAYRSARVLLLALLPVASGALAGIAAVGAVFGFVHGITLGFGVTLIGEAVDYAIYLFTQTPPGGRPREALARIWPTLRLGMLTSVCGFSAMLFSHFIGFAQLGLFTVAGLVTALAVTRFVLPALLPDMVSTAGSTAFAGPVLALIRARAWLRWAVLAAVVIAGASLVTHGAPYWEDELASMSPIPRADLALDTRLRGELGAPDASALLVVVAADREAALAAGEQVASLLPPLIAAGRIAGFDAPGTWLPSQATQAARRAALPDAATLRANLAAAVAGLPLRAELFAPFLADVAAARDGDLLRRPALDGTGLALQVDTLLVRHGDGWAALLPLRGVADNAAMARAVAALDVPGLVFLDLKRESDNLLSSYRAEAVTLSAVGSLAIIVLLVAHLRAPRRIAAVLLPLAAAVLGTAALLAAGGQRLSIFNLFGLLLVVAVGSNYCLFLERPHADPRRMVASLTLADLCTVIGFGVLGFSRVPVLHGIGTTVAIGACLSLMFGAVLSPRRA